MEVDSSRFSVFEFDFLHLENRSFLDYSVIEVTIYLEKMTLENSYIFFIGVFDSVISMLSSPIECKFLFS